MQAIDHASVNTLRFLAADQVEKAKSGHPGFPLGTAPLMYTLWDRFMRYNPKDPNWFNRDRFVLSPGHGSALLYAMLHLAGYDVSMEELKNFRQWGSKTPGHPEYGHTAGVDASTGPLGHGFAMGVGFAVAEAMLAAKYNKPEFTVIDHYTYGLTSDGDLMEGVASEADSLAGTLGLGKLIYLYDDNKITIEGSTDIAFTEDVEARFKAYGWQVLRVADSEDIEAMEAAVQRQLMSDVPYGVLLSGGLDSSIISAVAKKYAAKRIETDSQSDAWWPQLHSFAVGLKGAPDLAAAKKVADHIGTVHHEINYTVQEGLDAIRDVIYNIETYDVTTVRASTPMYLLARVIKSMGIKMVLSGEGADEVFGGYLYFHKAPNAAAFHEETIRKLSKLHLYDCLRANKSLSAWGVEGRVPFLDKEFLDVAMRINPAAKMAPGKVIEKKILREAFSDMLPQEIAWRQKEQFSDGVGYNWIDTLKKVTSQAVTDQAMAHAAKRFPINTPQNKEEYYYRTIFEEHFPSSSAARSVPSVPSVACSTPEALAWDSSFSNLNDPSGRAVKGVHADSY